MKRAMGGPCTGKKEEEWTESSCSLYVLLKDALERAGDGSAGKSTHCCCVGPEFSSRTPHQVARTTYDVSSWGSNPSGLCGLCIHIHPPTYRHIHKN